MSMILRYFFSLLLLCVSLSSVVFAEGVAVSAEARAQQYVQQGDWQAARKAFAVAAEAGSPSAMAYLGWMHEEGHGVEPGEAMAVIWYTRAVEAGATHLANKLGWMHLAGSEVVKDRALSEQWFMYGIEQGDLDAHVALASVLIADAQGGKRVERVGQAHSWLQAAHQGGHPVAKFFLARLYMEGIGGHPVDYLKTYEYARLGAEEGHPRMQGWLAHIYKEGLGREADPVEAAKWAMLSSAAGDPDGTQIYSALQAGMDASRLAEARERAMAWASQ